MNGQGRSSDRRPSPAGLLYASLGLAAALAMLATGAYYLTTTGFERDAEFARVLAEQRLLAQAMGRYGAEAARGNLTIFEAFGAARDRFGNELAELRSGDAETGLPPLPAELEAPLEALEKAWQQTDAGVSRVLAQKPAVADTFRLLRRFESFAADTLLKSDELVNVMVETGASPEQVYAATRQLMLLERLAHNLRRALTGDAEAGQAGEHFDRDVMHFRQVTRALLGGDEKLGIEPVADSEARALLEELLAAFAGEPAQGPSSVDDAGALSRLQEAAVATIKSTDALGEAVQSLFQAYQAWSGQRLLSPLLATLLASLGLGLTLVALALAMRPKLPPQQEAEREEGVKILSADSREADFRETQLRTQAAVLRLLKETRRVADGDSSVVVTVTDDLVGRVAEAVSRLSERLRQVVVQARATAERVRLSAGATGVASQALLGKLGRETAALDNAVAAGQRLESTFGTLTTAARKSRMLSAQALQSVTGGRAGIETAAHSLDATRERLQEAAKQMKRLGESCQATGELAALIDDVAEQANILALNAAIQAAATSSERGFSVVADEVQRLAERFADASRQMGALVSSMQSGTREATASVEGVTAGIVETVSSVDTALRDMEALQSAAKQWEATSAHLVSAVEAQQEPAQTIGKALPVARDLSERVISAGKETVQRMAALRTSAEALTSVLTGVGSQPPEQPPGDPAGQSGAKSKRIRKEGTESDGADGKDSKTSVVTARTV